MSYNWVARLLKAVLRSDRHGASRRAATPSRSWLDPSSKPEEYSAFLWQPAVSY